MSPRPLRRLPTRLATTRRTTSAPDDHVLASRRQILELEPETLLARRSRSGRTAALGRVPDRDSGRP